MLAEGSTKASIWLAGGLQIDLRVLPAHLYGKLLQHFTGSREHNIQLREMAVRKGLRVSENGILELATGKNLTCRTEEEVYAALGLSYIPPDLRQGVGEIDAAAHGTLPDVVSEADLRGDFHMHCTWSDGAGDLETMIAGAARRGYAYHSISDHSEGRGSYGLDAAALREQRDACASSATASASARSARARSTSSRTARSSLARDVLAELDIVVASVHAGMRIGREKMTQRLIRACENPYVNIIGHPTGRQLGAFEGYEFDYDAVFEAAARTGTALEIDGQPGRLDLRARSRVARASSASRSRSTATRIRPISSPTCRTRSGQARRGWVAKDEVLNARPLDGVLAFVAAKRARASA